MPHHRPLDAAGHAAVRRDPDVHARAAHDRPRRRRRGRLRHPVRHGDELPDGAALRPRGDPLRRRRCCGRTTRRSASNVVETLSIVDYGDVPVSPGDTGRTYGQIEEALAPLVEAGVFPLALGGDHSVTLAELRVLARKHGPLALVQLDAHGDTWDEYFGQRYFHGTTFKRAVEEGLIEPRRPCRRACAARSTAQTTSSRHASSASLSSRATSCGGWSPAASRASSGSAPAGDPSFSPSTSTCSTRPSPPERARPRSAVSRRPRRSPSSARCAGIELAGADVVEVSPPYDGPGQPTALAAANVAYEILSLRALAAAQG